MYEVGQHGNAEYRSWAEIPSAWFPDELEEQPAWELRRYAKLVWIVNPLALSASTIDVDTSELQAIESIISADIRYIKEYGNIDRALAIYIETNGVSTFVGEAVPGSELTSSVWRCKCVEEAATVTRIRWADGDAEFDNPADNIQSLNYT